MVMLFVLQFMLAIQVNGLCEPTFFLLGGLYLSCQVFNPRPVIPISSSNPNQIEKALVDVHNRTAQQGKQLQLLIIILPDVSGSYGE